MRKNAAHLVIILLTIFLFSGCLGGREINDLEIVIGMGVDKCQDTQDIIITAQVVKEAEVGRTSDESGGGKAYWNVTGNGKSVFDAIRKVTHKTGNRLFVSHSQVVIFGNDLASEGLQEYIDFFLRAHEMRPTALILIAEDQAADIMDAKQETEKFPAINIVKLVKSYRFTSHFYKVNMKDFVSSLMCETTAPTAPIVKVMEEEGQKNIHIYGMAVFKNDKMVGKLVHEETRGLLWVLGKVESRILLVPYPEDQGLLSLEILKAESKVTPKIENGKIVMHIKIKQESSLAEQSSALNLTTMSVFEKIEKAQSEVIRKEIMTAFEKSKELNADIFGFGRMLHKKYKNEWEKLKDRWDEVYPTIELDIEIEAKIQKTDLLVKPAAPGQKEE